MSRSSTPSLSFMFANHYSLRTIRMPHTCHTFAHQILLDNNIQYLLRNTNHAALHNVVLPAHRF